MKQGLKIHERNCKSVINNELSSEDSETMRINTSISVGETDVDRRSEYLSCPKCGIEFPIESDLELHLEFCQHKSKNSNEASTSSRSLSGEGSNEVKNIEGPGGGNDRSVTSFKEEISEEPGDPDPVSTIILEFMSR